MVWFRVDDVLPFHARVLEAGNAAMGLWVRAGAWSAGQLTDGHIPTAVAKQLGTAAEIRRLVLVGLWTTDDERGGYLFHAWAEDGTGTKRQPTRAEVESQRKAERDRKAAYRAGRKDGQQESTTRPPGVPAGHTPDNQQASEHPDPTRPDHVPSDEGTSLSPGKRAKRRTTIPDDFAPNDNHRRYAAEHHLDLDAELTAFENHARMNARLGADWDAGFRNWLAKAAQFAAQRRGPAPVRESSLDRRDRQREQMFADLDGLEPLFPKAVGA